MKLSSYYHGNCELCDEQEGRIAALEKEIEIMYSALSTIAGMDYDEIMVTPESVAEDVLRELEAAAWRRTIKLSEPDKEATKLYRAVAEYLEAKGGQPIVVGKAQIQQEPNDLKYNFSLVIRCMGKMPEASDDAE